MGNLLDKVSAISCPEADQLKTSNYPGVSIKIKSVCSYSCFSISCIKSGSIVEKRLRHVKIAPFGPN